MLYVAKGFEDMHRQQIWCVRTMISHFDSTNFLSTPPPRVSSGHAELSRGSSHANYFSGSRLFRSPTLRCPYIPKSHFPAFLFFFVSFSSLVLFLFSFCFVSFPFLSFLLFYFRVSFEESEALFPSSLYHSGRALLDDQGGDMLPTPRQI
jgi:hypothetical protein